METEERSLTTFTGIELDIEADLEITPGDGQAPTLSITAESKLIRNILTHVEDGLLKIRFDRCVRKHENILIKVQSGALNNLILTGLGSVVFVDTMTTTALKAEVRGAGTMDLSVRGDSMTSVIEGAGTITLRGNATNQVIRNYDSGAVKAFDLNTTNTFVEINGSGGCEVRALELLDAKIDGSGDVLYKGSPQIVLVTTGTGSLIKSE